MDFPYFTIAEAEELVEGGDWCYQSAENRDFCGLSQYKYLDFQSISELVDYGFVEVYQPKIYLCNSVPNSFQPKPGHKIITEGIFPNQVSSMLKSSPFISAVRHLNTIEFINYSCNINIDYKTNENGEIITEMVTPLKGDQVIACIVKPPKRLSPQEQWTEEDFKNMEHSFLLIHF
jgi:hypothetical protein